SAANRSMHARPIPDRPPVTTTSLSSNRCSMRVVLVAPRSTEEVAGQRLPKFGAQVQRLGVDPFVVAVEHGGQLVVRDAAALQAEAVAGRPGPAEEARIGCAGHQRGQGG